MNVIISIINNQQDQQAKTKTKMNSIIKTKKGTIVTVRAGRNETSNNIVSTLHKKYYSNQHILL